MSSASSCVGASTIRVTASMSMSFAFCRSGGKPVMNPFETTANLYFTSHLLEYLVEARSADTADEEFTDICGEFWERSLNHGAVTPGIQLLAGDRHVDVVHASPTHELDIELILDGL